MAKHETPTLQPPNHRDLLKPLPLLPSRRAMLQEALEASESRNGGDDANAELRPISAQALSANTLGTSNSGDNPLSTIKKGPLWQQKNFDKIHHRLFNRWKKRFFILTTDYLVCFNKSSSKVGRSEMGKFLYKVSLSTL